MCVVPKRNWVHKNFGSKKLLIPNNFKSYRVWQLIQAKWKGTYFKERLLKVSWSIIFNRWNNAYEWIDWLHPWKLRRYAKKRNAAMTLFFVTTEKWQMNYRLNGWLKEYSTLRREGQRLCCQEVHHRISEFYRKTASIYRQCCLHLHKTLSRWWS